MARASILAIAPQRQSPSRDNAVDPVAWAIGVWSIVATLVPAAMAADPSIPDPQSVARAIDRHCSPSSPASGDTAYLARTWLDVVGMRPTVAHIDAFARNSGPNKREMAVEHLLDDPRFGQHWGRYWRDVILARRADERALRLVSEGLVEAVADRINGNDGWDKIARDFITASGNVRQHGETGLFLAQKGEPENITAEVARIFLGMQIQCAQCHDHPTDEWKREQFHQMAAFFPRVGVRRVGDGKPRSFEVYSRNKKGRGKKKQNKKAIEHYMPDLAHPELPGEITKPVFFLTGHSLELGTKDHIRRQALADWLTTAEENPWFAKAYVNRIWTELIGQGFYDSVDDIGPGHDCRNSDVLTLLAENFVAAGYDTKWLFRTIMATSAYQSASSQSDPPASVPTPALRSDVVFDNLIQIFEIDQKGSKKPKQKAAARQNFQQVFFYDPSLPRDEINPTIPQALMMMNGPQIHQLLRGDRRGTMLSRLLRQHADNQAIVEALYLRCLARKPKNAEQATCLAYIKTQENRTEACEDILWSLINTAEFRHRN